MTTAARTVSATAMTGAVLILLGAKVVSSRSRPDEPADHQGSTTPCVTP